MIIQIYEIRSPSEAQALISMGVNHIGTVLTAPADAELPELQETIHTVRRQGAKLSLIPLFNDAATVIQSLKQCVPDLVHFCQTLSSSARGDGSIENAILLQQQVKQHFPHMAIMRTIPISPPNVSDPLDSLNLASRFEPVSDYFLTDTILGDNAAVDAAQPVAGFVGITGKTCDWKIAAKLAATSRIPVILAGGISPDNVCDGILQVRPAGIDSCTQTNALDSNGNPIRFQKDFAKVKQLIHEARRAQDLIINSNK